MTDSRLDERLERFSEQVMLLLEQHLDDITAKTQSSSDNDDSCLVAAADSKSECDDDDMTTATEDETEDDIDDDKSVDLDLDDMQNDLSCTANSLSTLELEFSKDLEALAFGIESAFDQFEEEDLVELTKSTQTQFKATVQKSLQQQRNQQHQRKRQRRRRKAEEETDILIPVCLDDFYNNNEPPKEGEAEVVEDTVDPEFQNWFQKVWASIQSALLNKQQKQQLQQSETASMDDSTLYRVWTQE